MKAYIVLKSWTKEQICFVANTEAGVREYVRDHHMIHMGYSLDSNGFEAYWDDSCKDVYEIFVFDLQDKRDLEYLYITIMGKDK
jgi:hypothetical protein